MERILPGDSFSGSERSGKKFEIPSTSSGWQMIDAAANSGGSGVGRQWSVVTSVGTAVAKQWSKLGSHLKHLKLTFPSVSFHSGIRNDPAFFVRRFRPQIAQIYTD
jgi:hypothetical protein